jgi:5'-nucleotidase
VTAAPPLSENNLRDDAAVPSIRQVPLPQEKRVFCNRTLRMSDLSWIGFDMDYTLAIYNQQEMDELSIRSTLTKLIARGYPEFVRNVPHLTSFPVRGLLIDKACGHVLKMDRYKYVAKGYHGTRELSKEEIRTLYHAQKIKPATTRYHWIDTLYALSEVAVYSALVDAFEANGMAVDYDKLFCDIRECIDEAHRDGTILDTITSDLPRYVNKDKDLAACLHKLRSGGKRLFLVTNSRREYTEKMLTYLLGDASGEYPTWQAYFDIVIVAAKKPVFFQEERPLMEWDGDQLKPAKLPLERGKVYEGGNYAELERGIAVPGDEVLYVGDHIYGDILRLKKDSAWRTSMIIQELDVEVMAHQACRADYARIEEIDLQRERFEDELRAANHRVKTLTKRGDDASGERAEAKGKTEQLRAALRALDAEYEALNQVIAERFHPYWGSLLKEESEQSIFGQQVEDYACVYTARVSNFGAYSAQHTFRSRRDEMPHEFGDG